MGLLFMSNGNASQAALPASRRLSKAQTAQFFDVSLPTVEGWIRRGCPVIERGDRGRRWTIDPLAVVEWQSSRQISEATPPTHPDDMTPQDRKAWYESEMRRRDLQRRDRELYERADVLRTFTVTIATFAEQMRALPDRLEREAGIDGQAAALVESTVDAHLEMLRRELMAVIDD